MTVVDSRAMEAIERGRYKLTLDAMVDKKLGLENISEQIAPVGRSMENKIYIVNLN